MAEPHPKLAKDTANTALQFLAGFDTEKFGIMREDSPGPHDRRHLAIALDYIQELGAMVLNLADRVPTNAEVKGGRRLKSALISLAAQMATRRGMPAPDDWPGWGPRVPQKLWRAARGECDKAGDQCGEWAYELRKIADAL